MNEKYCNEWKKLPWGHVPSSGRYWCKDSIAYSTFQCNCAQFNVCRYKWMMFYVMFVKWRRIEWIDFGVFGEDGAEGRWISDKWNQLWIAFCFHTKNGHLTLFISNFDWKCLYNISIDFSTYKMNFNCKVAGLSQCDKNCFNFKLLFLISLMCVIVFEENPLSRHINWLF